MRRGAAGWTRALRVVRLDVPRAGAAVAALFCLLALLGWVVPLTPLITAGPGWAAFDASTAVALLSAAAALWLLSGPAPGGRARGVAFGLAAFTGVVGLSMLVGYLYRLEGLLKIVDPTSLATGRAQASTAAALVLLSLALLAADTETRRQRRPAELAAFAVAGLGLLALLAYAFGLTLLPLRYTEMAVHGALALIALAVGVLALHPDRGWVGVLGSRTPASAAVRRVGWWMLPAPLLIGAAITALVRGGGLEAAWAPALLAAFVTFALGASLVRTSLGLHRGELERRRTEQRLQAQHQASRVLAAAGTLEDALPRVLEAIGQALDWDAGVSWRVDAEASVLRCTHVWRREGVKIDPFEQKVRESTYAPGVGMPGRVWMTGEPVWNQDLQRYPSFRKAAAIASGLRAGVSFPIRVGQRVIGVVELFRREQAEPDPELMGSVSVLGAQLGESMERKTAEEGLRASEERFRLLIEGIRDYAIFMLGRDGLLSSWNEAAERITGLGRQELLGRPFHRLVPRNGGPSVDPLHDAQEHGRVELEGWVVRNDGSRFWSNIVLSPLHDREGAVSGYTAVMRDMSQRKEEEDALRAARDEARASRDELESFSYSVSHDLRAPLRTVDGFAQALVEDHSEGLPPEALDYLGRIRGAAQKMAQLIEDLLKLSRATRAKMSWAPVSLSELARTVVADLQAADPGRQVTVRIEDGLEGQGDPHLLKVVLVNLLGNAWKFTAGKAQASIEVGAFTREGERVYFVRDDGAGFDMAYASRLFQPFERLHGEEEFPGSGIGLATVARVVRRHRGRVWAESKPGQGATFSFTLGHEQQEGER